MNQYRGESREETESKLQYLFEYLYDILPTEDNQKEGRLKDSLGCLLANYVNEKHLILIEMYHDNNYFQITDYDGSLVDTWHRNDRIFKSRDPINERIRTMTRKNGSIIIDYEGGYESMHWDNPNCGSMTPYVKCYTTYAHYFKLKNMVKNGTAIADWEKRDISLFETENPRGEYWEALF